MHNFVAIKWPSCNYDATKKYQSVFPWACYLMLVWKCGYDCFSKCFYSEIYQNNIFFIF
jgi:hypothetical protein